MRTFKFAFVLFALIVSSCKKNDDSPKTFAGVSVQIGNGTAHTYVTMDDNNKPTTVGIRLTADALNGLPSDGLIPGFMLSLPTQAAESGFDHCEIDWNPNGHEPLFAYGVPHFDFHFYLVSEQEQASVIPGPDTIPVEAQYIPADYTSGIMAVPDMGTHWSDSTAPEFHGQPFTATFIYGFYHGSMTFLEPMVTRDFLQSKPDMLLPIKQPQSFQKNGYYPSHAHIFFDNSSNEYVIALEGLLYK